MEAFLAELEADGDYAPSDKYTADDPGSQRPTATCFGRPIRQEVAEADQSFENYSTLRDLPSVQSCEEDGVGGRKKQRGSWRTSSGGVKTSRHRVEREKSLGYGMFEMSAICACCVESMMG